jgi:hypothetical protein
MKNYTIVIDSIDPLEPTEQELRGAKFLVEQIEQCGDNTDKKIRLVAMIMHNINQTIDQQKSITIAAYHK